MRILKILAAVAIVASVLAAQASSAFQVAQFHPFVASSGVIGNHTQSTMTVELATLTEPSAPWMQIRFSQIVFQKGASIRLIGNQGQDEIFGPDGSNPVTVSRQLLGDRVQVELVVPPAALASVTMSGYDAAIPPAPVSGDSLCDLIINQDHRVYSVDSKVGRLLVTTATGMNVFTCFLVDDDVALTAGHCLAGAQAIAVEFNCPLSDPMGNMNPCQPTDVYVAIMSTVMAVNNGECDDYGAFRLAPNVLTGLKPGLVQGHWATEAPQTPIYFIEVNGYGPVAPQTPVPMVFNHTLRTAVDALVPAPPGCLWYEADTNEFGSDGGPIHDPFDEHVIGIHTVGGCNYFGVRNKGTPITNPGLIAMAATLGVTIPTPMLPPVTHGLHMWQGSGNAPIFGQVRGVDPDAELFNLFSAIPATPTGSGPLFGLNDGVGSGDPLAQAMTPLGTQPFHVVANSEGRYLLWLPVPAPSITLNVDMVSIALLPSGAVSVSNVINTTIRL